jgi:secondary thiamine-phosphate synthase enzyme
MLHEIYLKTKKHDEMIDITDQVQNFVQNIRDGLAVVYCHHTADGITINENADPDVQKDFLRRLDEIYPWESPKDRHLEGNSAAHLKASTVGASQTITKNYSLAAGREFTFVSLMDRGSGVVMLKILVKTRGEQ